MITAQTLEAVSSLQVSFGASLAETDFTEKRLSVARKRIKMQCLDRLAELTGDMETALDKVRATSVQDRQAMADIARRTYDLANSLDSAIASASNRTIKDKLEDLFCRLEDIAETAALVSSEEFERLVDSEIQRFFDAQTRARG